MSINIISKEIGKVEELARKSVEIKSDVDMCINYRLVKAKYSECFYFVTVNNDTEKEVVCAGVDENKAKIMFDALVSGKVTPCAAADIARDMYQLNCDEK